MRPAKLSPRIVGNVLYYGVFMSNGKLEKED